MATAILYQNTERDITLIDIPASIAVAQGGSDVLLSSEPLEEPFIIANEPKTTAAKEKITNNTVDQELHAEYSSVIAKALSEICGSVTNVSGNWSLPRKLLSQVPKPRDAS